MLKIYGSMLCPDCVACCKAMDEAGREYVFLDFAQKLSHLKEYLKLRDTEPVFDPLRGGSTIGIPCVVLPDGTVTLDWESV